MEAIRAIEEAAHFREEAKSCLQVAERMPAVGDRAWLLEMAQHWLEMAIKAEDSEPGKHPRHLSPAEGRCPALAQKDKIRPGTEPISCRRLIDR
jgi:hypothetical protein